MKNIFLIGAFPDGLKTTRSYLSEINLNYSEFSSVKDAVESGRVPSLIVLLADKNMKNFDEDVDSLKNSPSFSRIPRIYIFPFEMPGVLPAPGIIDGQSSFQMPVDKLKFLSSVSTFLKRPPRRVFRILITVIPDGSNLRYSGVSMDFSETGMAFESVSDFHVGDKININFVNPRNRKRFLLKAEIIRKASTQPGSNTFYGVMFSEMTDKDAKELMSFLSGGN